MPVTEALGRTALPVAIPQDIHVILGKGTFPPPSQNYLDLWSVCVYEKYEC